MKKTTSKKWSDNLARYGAMAAALGGMADAYGQIDYTDIDPNHSGGVGNDYFLDINNDGINDFKVHSETSGVYVTPLASNAVLGSGSYPYALGSGAVISAGAAGIWNGSSYQAMNIGNCAIGNWCAVNDGYLGLRFDAGGSSHYGWARLDVSNAGAWVLKDYAYNQTPDALLNAGQQTLSVTTPNMDAVRVVSINKTIGLYQLEHPTEYTLYSMTGQEVMSGITAGDSYVIEAPTLRSGVYLLALEDRTSKTQLKKKIVL